MTLDIYFKKTINYSFHLLFLLTPLIWTAKMSELFEFPKMLFVYAMTVVIAASWISRMIIQKKILIQKTPFDIPLVLFLTSQIISTIVSIDPHTSIFGYYSRFHGGLLSTITYITLFYAFVSNISSVKPFIRITLIGAVVASLYAFVEHFGISPSCKLIGAGWPATCWIQDVINRVFGTFGQPNWLAAYLISLTFLPISLLIKKGKSEDDNFWLKVGTWLPAKQNYQKKKDSQNKSVTFNQKFINETLINILIFILFFSVLLFTKSRSGIFGFSIGLGVFSLMTVLISTTKKKTFFLLLACYFLLTTNYIFLGKGSIPQIDNLLKKPSQEAPQTQVNPQVQVGTVLDNGGTESGDIRKIVWTGALDVFKHNPLFGSGVETFGYSYYNFRPIAHNNTSEWDFLYNKAHNEWLNQLANSGLFGLGSYLFLMLSFILYSLKNIFDKKNFINAKNINTALLSGYISLAISNFFGFSTVPVGVLFFIFPAFAFTLSTSSTSIANENKPKDQLTNGQSVGLFITIVLCLLSLFQVYKMYAADKAYASGKSYNDQNQIQNALTSLEKSIKLMPSEPTYKDEFAQASTNAALYFYEQNQATAAAKIAALAIQASNQALEQNKVHLNFYKTQARLLANLGAFEPQLLQSSTKTLEKAIELSPTDAKLYFSLGMVYYQLEDLQKATTLIEKSIQLKPNYELARFTLGEIYQNNNKLKEATNQYDYILTNIAPNNAKAKDKLDEINSKMVK